MKRSAASRTPVVTPVIHAAWIAPHLLLRARGKLHEQGELVEALAPQQPLAPQELHQLRALLERGASEIAYRLIRALGQRSALSDLAGQPAHELWRHVSVCGLWIARQPEAAGLIAWLSPERDIESAYLCFNPEDWFGWSAELRALPELTEEPGLLPIGIVKAGRYEAPLERQHLNRRRTLEYRIEALDSTRQAGLNPWGAAPEGLDWTYPEPPASSRFNPYAPGWSLGSPSGFNDLSDSSDEQLASTPALIVGLGARVAQQLGSPVLNLEQLIGRALDWDEQVRDRNSDMTLSSDDLIREVRGWPTNLLEACAEHLGEDPSSWRVDCLRAALDQNLTLEGLKAALEPLPASNRPGDDRSRAIRLSGLRACLKAGARRDEDANYLCAQAGQWITDPSPERLTALQVHLSTLREVHSLWCGRDQLRTEFFSLLNAALRAGRRPNPTPDEESP